MKKTALTSHAAPDSIGTLRPDDRLLLACARAHRDTGAAAEIRALAAAGPDWERFARQAQRHGLVPLIYRNIHYAGLSSAIPAELLGAFRMAYHQNSLRSHLMAGEVAKIAKALRAEGIEAIFYKGPALAVRAYGNVALRVFCDLDILIRKDEVLRANGILKAGNYQDRVPLSRHEEEVHLDSGFEFELYCKERAINIEIQWHLYKKMMARGYDNEKLWERAEAVEFRGERVLTLSTGDYLTYLAFHGTWHVWESLHWIEDLAELAGAAPGLDWERVWAEAARLGMRRRLSLAVMLAEELLGAKVPEAILRKCRGEKRLRKYRSMVMKVLFERERGCYFTEKHYFQIGLMEHFRDRCRYLRNVISTPNARDTEFLKVPQKWAFLYHLARPVRQVKKFLPVLMNDLRGMSKD